MLSLLLPGGEVARSLTETLGEEAHYSRGEMAIDKTVTLSVTVL